MRACMGEPDVVIAGDDPLDDVFPGDGPEQCSVRTIDGDHFVVRVDLEDFPLMSGRRGD